MENTAASQKEARKLWVRALCSGLYKQGETYLHREDEYCCLGVACEIYPGVLEVRVDGRGVTSYDAKAESLPDSVKDWLGLRTNFGDYVGDDAENALTLDNDTGLSFEEIAAIIESEPAGLVQ